MKKLPSLLAFLGVVVLPSVRACVRACMCACVLHLICSAVGECAACQDHLVCLGKVQPTARILDKTIGCIDLHVHASVMRDCMSVCV